MCGVSSAKNHVRGQFEIHVTGHYIKFQESFPRAVSIRIPDDTTDVAAWIGTMASRSDATDGGTHSGESTPIAAEHLDAPARTSHAVAPTLEW